ncbi:hypothetical protein C0J52_20230 [Blattella germanica]|nr:hypothetical protein C0J52_20230 [Blattella germanica]
MSKLSVIIHRVPLATEPDMNCNNFNNFNTNGDIAVKFITYSTQQWNEVSRLQNSNF